MIVIAALVIRTAITELRHPGSARRQWAFTTSPRAVAAGATAAAGGIVGVAGCLLADLSRLGTLMSGVR